MDITDIKIFKAYNRGPVVAYANIILNGVFIIRGIALVERENGHRFLSMPARKLRSEEKTYRDICHPLNSEVRTKLTEKIFGAYEEFINGAK